MDASERIGKLGDSLASAVADNESLAGELARGEEHIEQLESECESLSTELDRAREMGRTRLDKAKARLRHWEHRVYKMSRGSTRELEEVQKLLALCEADVRQIMGDDAVESFREVGGAPSVLPIEQHLPDGSVEHKTLVDTQALTAFAMWLHGKAKSIDRSHLTEGFTGDFE